MPLYVKILLELSTFRSNRTQFQLLVLEQLYQTMLKTLSSSVFDKKLLNILFKIETTSTKKRKYLKYP